MGFWDDNSIGSYYSAENVAKRRAEEERRTKAEQDRKKQVKQAKLKAEKRKLKQEKLYQESQKALKEFSQQYGGEADDSEDNWYFKSSDSHQKQKKVQIPNLQRPTTGGNGQPRIHQKGKAVGRPGAPLLGFHKDESAATPNSGPKSPADSPASKLTRPF